MDRATFEAEATKDGFEIKESSLPPGTNSPEHTHPFDARLFVISGEITIGRSGKAETYGPGDTCRVDAGTMHTETVRDNEVTYLVGHRKPE